MDLLKSMKAFVLTVNAGSFVGASLQLEISSQMVAKHVTFLEKKLGLTLLNRTTRTQHLTEFGAEYYERCLSIINDVEATNVLAQSFTDRPKGSLKVSAPVALGSFGLIPFLSDFMQLYPEITVDLQLSDDYVDLTADGFDVAFRIGDLADSGMRARRLHPFQLVACASPSYLGKFGTPEKPEALKNHNCLIYQYINHARKNDLWHFENKGEMQEVTVSGTFQCNNTFALMQAGLNGVGIINLPEFMVKDAIAQKKLMPILQPFSSLKREMHLLYLDRAQSLPKLHAFVQSAVDCFG